MGIPESVFPALISFTAMMLVMFATRFWNRADHDADGSATVEVAKINDGASMRKELQMRVDTLEGKLAAEQAKNYELQRTVDRLELGMKKLQDELVDARAEIRILRDRVNRGQGGTGG